MGNNPEVKKDVAFLKIVYWFFPDRYGVCLSRNDVLNQGEEERKLKVVISDYSIPDSHKCICESGLSGLQHVKMFQIWMGCKSCRPQTYSTYVGGSQDAAERQIWTFSDMLLTDQEKK